MEELDQGIKPQQEGIFIVGIGGRKFEPYPAWRYHEFFEPIVVENTEEDEEAQLNGYEELNAPITSNPTLVNWRIDLEDMNAEQLVLFIKDEFGIDLPVEAGEEKLIKSVWYLMKIAPQFAGRVCLLAQTIEMDYDAELEWIQEAAKDMKMDSVKEIEL